MKTRLLLIAGLLAGLALVATVTTADELPDPPTEEALVSLVTPVSEVYICHHPPGKNGRGADRANTGKIVVDVISLCDFSYLCIEDADDDFSEADGAVEVQGDAPAEVVPVGGGCASCLAAQDAYAAEIAGHITNHEGDCFSNTPVDAEDCEDLEPNGPSPGYCVEDD